MTVPPPTPRVELSSPDALRDGSRCYHVSFVEADGTRTVLYACTSYPEALAALADFDGGHWPAVDVAGAAPGEAIH